MELEKSIPRTSIHKFVEFEIYEHPGKAALEKIDIEPEARCGFNLITDEQIIRDDSHDLKGCKTWGYRIFVIYIISIIYLYIDWPGNFFNPFIIFFSAIFVLPSLFLFYYSKYGSKKKRIVFSRKSGTLEIPGAFWDKPHLFRFEDVHAVYSLGHLLASIPRISALRLRTYAKFFKLRGAVSLNIAALTYEAWSFWVWYMDKNRPLPPGNALDEFRQKDFERRKAEGFPPPLYKSKIPTPEATPEQQAEREKFWKDEDYFVSESA